MGEVYIVGAVTGLLYIHKEVMAFEAKVKIGLR